MNDAQARWRRIQQLCEAVESLPDEQQQARLRSLEPDDGIRNEVVALLVALQTEAAQQRLHSLRHPHVANDLPESIGGVRIEALLGSGGSGEVFRGVRTIQGVDHVVAVKRYHQHRSSVEDLERVTREQRLLATLTHPGIVRFFDAGVTTSGRPYLVMELADGLPLNDYADAKRLPLRARLELLLTACEAVESAHQLHIVHLDLKPSNIVVTTSGHVKLLDFGTAKLADPSLASTHTEPLTLQYASPERLRGESVSPSCDVYSLGLILAELCSGHWPFRQRESLAAIAERAAGTAAASLAGEAVTDHAAALRGMTRSELRRELAGDLAAITNRALAHDPDDRYPTVAAMAADIRRYLAGEPLDARPATFGRRFSRYFRGQRPGLLAALGLATIAAGSAGYLMLQRRDPVPPPPSARAETSMSTADGPISVVFDDVRWPRETTINHISWRGIYCTTVERAPAPPPSAIGFVVGVYADANGHPDRNAALFETMYPVARTNQQLRIAQQARCGGVATGVGFYNYEVTLDTPFRANAGVPYWVSVHAVVERSALEALDFVYWGWTGALKANNHSVQLNANGVARDLSSDRALEMTD